jgi:HSP20 family protein
MTDQAAHTKTKASEFARPEPARGSGVYFTPRVDVWENDQELLFHADVPGVKPEEISLNYENGELTLHARVQSGPEHERWFLNEYDVGDYYRTFTINQEIDPAGITADYKLGVLTVKLPKREEVKPRKILISA